MISESEEKLCSLLGIAATKFEELGNKPVWSSYDSGIDLARFVRDRISEIRGGNISFDNKQKLWYIFAPTMDWDDTVGDCALGDEIFQLLEKLYRPEIQKTNKQRENMAGPFAEAYPNIAHWIKVQGWIAIGDDEYSRSLVRCLDPGGMVWESSHQHKTIDEALQALEVALEKLLKELT
jgi:hypothetical protein